MMLHLYQTLKKSLISLRRNDSRDLLLLSDKEIQEIVNNARQNSATGTVIKDTITSTKQTGMELSNQTGAGYDFMENRVFNEGDDRRNLNWRIYARTGEKYKKTFYEEKNAMSWIILDQRSSMYFGTRERLKITQGARLALYYVYLSLYQGKQVGLITLQSDTQIHKPVQRISDLAPMIMEIISPSVVMSDKADGVTLPDCIDILNEFIKPGCGVYLISDYHDLDENAETSVYTLASRHHLYTVRITDNAEQTLPPADQYILYDLAKQDAYTKLNTSSPQERKRIESILSHINERITERLMRYSKQHQEFRTDDQIFNQLNA